MIATLPPAPALTSPELSDLQDRASRYVRELPTDAVIRYERYRAALRSRKGLPPVPATSRGADLLERQGYTLDSDGCLVLG